MQDVLRRLCAPFLILAILVTGGCSSSSHDSPAPSAGIKKAAQGNAGVDARTLAEVEGFLSERGLTLVGGPVTEASSGYSGYLARFTDLTLASAYPKYCMILTGTPYSMGYQAARLRPEACYEMLTTFMLKVGVGQLETLGLTIDPLSTQGRAVYDTLMEPITEFSHDTEAFIPADLRAEMQGIVDGMHDAGYPDVTYDDVLILNQGVDSTYYLMAAALGTTPSRTNNARALKAVAKLLQILPQAGATMAVENGALQLKELPQAPAGTRSYLRQGCNEFVLGAGVTRGGETYHGRDFMFPTAGVYEQAACIMVYLPQKGLPFVTVDPPGFVGHSVGINARGVSIGMDVSQGAAFGANVGVGTMLVARHVLDTSTSIAEAVEAVKSLEKGVCWIYVVAATHADPVYGSGVVLETGKSEPFTGPDLLPGWEQWLLSGSRIFLGGMPYELGIDYTGMLDTELPERGVMARGADWVFPAGFSGVNMSIPNPDPFFEHLERTEIGFSFPEQIETDPDVLVATNHFILPRMRYTQFHPLIWLIYRLGPLPESVWRYETQLGYILDNIGQGRRTEFFGPDPQRPAAYSAGWMIDFLNTNREHDWFYTEIPGWDDHVDGHHTVMNNTTGELRSLFGKMDDPWVGVNIADFAAWYYGGR